MIFVLLQNSNHIGFESRAVFEHLHVRSEDDGFGAVGHHVEVVAHKVELVQEGFTLFIGEQLSELRQDVSSNLNDSLVERRSLEGIEESESSVSL